MPEEEIQKKPWWHESMSVFVKVSTWIAAPVVIALFVGQYVDEKFKTTPWAFIGITSFAFIVSCFGIVKETKMYMDRISKEVENNKNKKHND